MRDGAEAGESAVEEGERLSAVIGGTFWFASQAHRAQEFLVAMRWAHLRAAEVRSETAVEGGDASGEGVLVAETPFERVSFGVGEALHLEHGFLPLTAALESVTQLSLTQAARQAEVNARRWWEDL